MNVPARGGVMRTTNEAPGAIIGATFWAGSFEGSFERPLERPLQPWTPS